jgi:hypothetical protein
MMLELIDETGISIGDEIVCFNFHECDIDMGHLLSPGYPYLVVEIVDQTLIRIAEYSTSNPVSILNGSFHLGRFWKCYQ